MKIVIRLAIWAVILGLSIAIAKADSLRVAVIDTGLALDDSRLNAHLCLAGHKDFTNQGIQDDYGHGTHVVGLIEQYASDADYCLVILKYSEDENSHMPNYLKGLREAVAQKVDIVNLSVSGENFDEEERELICGHPEITFVVAAGNEDRDLDVSPMYPASLGCSNIIVVGSKDFLKSNYGTMVHAFEQGMDVDSTLPNGKRGTNTGTSMSSAIRTGKLIHEKSIKKPLS